MNNLIKVAALSALFSIDTQAQCFVLRQATGNNFVKAIAEPTNWWALFGAKGYILPANSRMFQWNGQVPVRGVISFYGFGKDDPATPANEGTIMLHYPDVNVAPCYHGTYSFRFSQCDVQFLSDYDTRNLREFVAQIVFYNAVTGAYVDAAYFQWSR